MKCPVCGEEMVEGGLITDGPRVGWAPADQVNKSGLKKFVISDYHRIAAKTFSMGPTRIDNAWFCEKCHKVTGIFDASAKGDTIDFIIRRR